ncbi:MAG: MiaB/RimO family radical SAM methylthiotransferase [Nitrospinota bacterium]
MAGCLAERYQGELAQGLPEVDLFIGTREYDSIGDLLAEASGGALPAREAFSDTLMDYSRCLPRLLAEPGPSAYLKVAEGCSRPCTFCVIPRFRGRFRSRAAHHIIEEAEALAAAGVKEVNLLAQEITSYGTEIGEGHSLAKLLERLEDLRWIRILYNYPRGVTDELLDAIRDLPWVVEYIDMPLQHIATPVLTAMRRGIDEAGTRALIEKIRRAIPGCALRTTMLVGFPGETEEDFKALLDFVRETRFTRLGAFAYSSEEGSFAARLPDPVPKEAARERLRRLLSLQEEIQAGMNAALVGGRCEVFVEGVTAEGLLRGRTRHQAPEVDGEVFLHETEAGTGEIIDCEILDTDRVDLIARGI